RCLTRLAAHVLKVPGRIERCPEDLVKGAAVRPGSGTLVALQHTVSEGRLSGMRTREGTILVAEDDPSIRRLVEWALEDEGFVVEAVPDGADAIRRLADRRPALLILDVMMPRAD